MHQGNAPAEHISPLLTSLQSRPRSRPFFQFYSLLLLFFCSNPAANSDSLLTRILTFGYLDWFHFRLLLWPNIFCPDWRSEVPLVESLADPRAALTLAFFAGLAALVWTTIRLTLSQNQV